MRKLLALVGLVAIVALALIQFGPSVVFADRPASLGYARAGAR